MLTRLKLWREQRQQARSLYGSIVTQARSRGLYAHLGVPDTPEGRFEMLALHLVVVLDRLDRTGDADGTRRRFARALTEAFAEDVDDNLREMSVGDLAVPRHVKRAVGALTERYAGYRDALAATDDGPMIAAIRSRLAESGAGPDLDAQRICAYIKGARHRLDAQPSAEVIAGCVAWPRIGATGDGAQGRGDDGERHA